MEHTMRDEPDRDGKIIFSFNRFLRGVHLEQYQIGTTNNLFRNILIKWIGKWGVQLLYHIFFGVYR